MNIFILFFQFIYDLDNPNPLRYRDRLQDIRESALHKILLNNRLHRHQYILNNFKSREAKFDGS